MKKVLVLFLAFVTAFLNISFYVPVAANSVANDSITIDSTASNNEALHMNFEYFYGHPRVEDGKITANDFWPKRSEGCGGANDITSYKTFPYLPENTTPVKVFYGENASTFNGNTLKKSGNCSNRYWDGGNANGIWVPEDVFGGWAQLGDGYIGYYPDRWKTAVSLNSEDESNPLDVYSKKLAGKGYTDQIWSSRYRGTGDGDSTNEEQDDQLFKNNGYSNYKRQTGCGSDGSQICAVYSSGTTFFRNEFEITQEQYDRLSNGDASAILRVAADDFVKVYLNGLPLANAESAETVTPINLDLKNNISDGNLQNLFQVGDNLLAFQVHDKARWSAKGSPSDSHGAGLWYELEINLGSSSPTLGSEPSLSCSAEPQQGPIPLVVTFTISGENLTSENFDFYPDVDSVSIPYTLDGGSKTIYYTYDSAGTYRPYVSSSETGQSYCTVGSSSNGVNVTDPRESSGGETTP